MLEPRHVETRHKHQKRSSFRLCIGDSQPYSSARGLPTMRNEMAAFETLRIRLARFSVQRTCMTPCKLGTPSLLLTKKLPTPLRVRHNPERVESQACNAPHPGNFQWNAAIQQVPCMAFTRRDQGDCHDATHCGIALSSAHCLIPERHLCTSYSHRLLLCFSSGTGVRGSASVRKDDGCNPA